MSKRHQHENRKENFYREAELPREPQGCLVYVPLEVSVASILQAVVDSSSQAHLRYHAAYDGQVSWNDTHYDTVRKLLLIFAPALPSITRKEDDNEYFLDRTFIEVIINNYLLEYFLKGAVASVSTTYEKTNIHDYLERRRKPLISKYEYAFLRLGVANLLKRCQTDPEALIELDKIISHYTFVSPTRPPVSKPELRKSLPRSEETREEVKEEVAVESQRPLGFKERVLRFLKGE